MNLDNQTHDLVPLCQIHGEEVRRTINSILEASECSDAMEALFWPLRYIQFRPHPLNTSQQCHRCLNKGSQNRRSGTRAY